MGKTGKKLENLGKKIKIYKRGPGLKEFPVAGNAQLQYPILKTTSRNIIYIIFLVSSSRSQRQ